MAIARGAGTEILRCASFSDVDSTVTKLIIGVQYHIYTVLSLIAHALTVTSGDNFYMRLDSWDSKGASSGAGHILFRWFGLANQTYVWNDKFSFNGYDPTGFSGALSTVAEQDALADQGGGANQELVCAATDASTNIEVIFTYIDQNNA
tara:strand:+ start:149 stop:595 length:447 start_codon:yes stop_codon:yes gene_type:complete